MRTNCSSSSCWPIPTGLSAGRGGDGSTGVMVGGRGIRLDRSRSSATQSSSSGSTQGGPSRRDARSPGQDRQRDPARMARRTLSPGNPSREIGPCSTKGRRPGRRRLDPLLSRFAIREDRNTAGRARRRRRPLAKAWLREAERSSGRRSHGELAGPARPGARRDRRDRLARIRSRLARADRRPVSASGARRRSDPGRCWILKSRLSFGQTAARRAGARGADRPQRQPDQARLPARRPADPGGPAPGAVRLAETPRVAGRRVAVVLHLLGPNYRPVQITDDLRSFWANAYFQVRKDLRGRYPKHSWARGPPRDAQRTVEGRSAAGSKLPDQIGFSGKNADNAPDSPEHNAGDRLIPRTGDGAGSIDRGWLDDFKQIRQRRAGWVWPESDLIGGGVPAFVGQVTSSGSNIGVGDFLL